MEHIPIHWRPESESLRRVPAIALLTVFVLFAGNGLQPTMAQDGLKLPNGFEAALIADDALAHDIYSMTVDSLGRVVVSGPGYVRILLDTDADGKADTYRQYADGPANGAQGLFFHGRDLLCTGDAGLIRYRDRDGDDRADGPPELFLKLKTGGEHHAHAVRQGPDGCWYVIVGNMADVNEEYVTSARSPVQNPKAGTILRLSSDLTGGEVFAHGFRNAYDFAFHSVGDIFTYDSDGERDVSLPWYRPTRVFHVLPGSHAGWWSRSWKRPGNFYEMPPVLVDFGRGSPTGVVCYRHRQFPHQYQNALLVADWTFGRVWALPLARAGSTWSTDPILFIRGVGQFGFAPTDMEIGPDGSLYVCIGGRGTRGGVYRIRYVGGEEERVTSYLEQPEAKTVQERLTRCLEAPCPLTSWSRAVWMPIARELDRETFNQALLETSRPLAQRIRAVEILTELFGGVDEATAQQLSRDVAWELRARVVWSLSQRWKQTSQEKTVEPFLDDANPFVARYALETMLQAGWQNWKLMGLHAGLLRRLRDDDHYVRQTASRVVEHLRDDDFAALSRSATRDGWRASIANAFGFTGRNPGFQSYTYQLGLTVLEDEFPLDLKRDAVRLMQVGIGDVGVSGDLPAVFDGYTSRLKLSIHERELDDVRIRLAKIYPTGETQLDHELGRLIAMLNPFNPKLLEKVLQQITEDSSPVDDIHHLIISARIPAPRTMAQRTIIAKAFVRLDEKIAKRGLQQDTNWENRVHEIYEQHAKIDNELAQLLLKQPGFGRPGHVMFLSQFSRDWIDETVAAFVAQIKAQGEDYGWTNEVVFAIADSGKPEYLELIRKQYDNFGVRNAVIRVLARQPEEKDREKFLQGLESSQLEVLSSALDALEALPASENGSEQAALLKAVRRLGTAKGEYPLRERIVKLLRRNTGQAFGFVFGKKGNQPQLEAVKSWTDYVLGKYPELKDNILGGSASELTDLREMLKRVDWPEGDSQKGENLFEKRACVQCHGGRAALGPDLKGVTGRFSRDDLFIAIALPNRDVSPRYQTTMIGTMAGKVYTGLVIYESVDGLILRNGTNETFRIEADEIEFRKQLNNSLMPSGLLKDLQPADYANLYSYLQSMGVELTKSQAAASAD